MVDLNKTLLGKSTDYVDQYAPSLLYPLPRKDKRQELGIDESDLPFTGVDIWNTYELSWLNASGLPQVALCEFRVPCSSKNIIESKSFKLYLNSLNQTLFESVRRLEKTLVDDLSRVAEADVDVKIVGLNDPDTVLVGDEGRVLLDQLDIADLQYDVDSSLLTRSSSHVIEESLVSHLLKTNCPVTGQPDWASVLVDYRGAAISHEGLLRYIVSYRNHQDFHEQCVERIFKDIMSQCEPEMLTVSARYTRRGGLDINPVRSTESLVFSNARLSRQ